MRKILLLPDSFKGTMSAVEVCATMKRAIHRHLPQAEVISMPVADGGEGTVDCFLHALGGERIVATVQNAFGEPCLCSYLILPDKQTAVIEMAACAGLPAAEGRLNPESATTFGVGELILDAARQGVKRIILGLGGSATNDGGCGAACAVGVRFFRSDNREFIPTGGTLKEISHIDLSNRAPLLNGVDITVMCDIDNPLYGKYGAAYIFSPQKGADPDMVLRLDKGLEHLNCILLEKTQKNFQQIPGSGAAGGMGAGMLAFFGAQLNRGIDTALEAIHFDDHLTDADLIITGEGCFDRQSLSGKVVMGISRRAKAHHVPVIAVVGKIGAEIEQAYEEGLTALFSINTAPMPFSESRHHALENLSITMDNLLRLIAVC